MVQRLQERRGHAVHARRRRPDRPRHQACPGDESGCGAVTNSCGRRRRCLIYRSVGFHFAGETTMPFEHAGAWADERTAQDEALVRKSFWAKARRVAAGIPFAEDLVAAYFCAFDHETPLQVKAALLGALAYFVLPFDVIPDVLPMLGYTDDA